MPHALAPLPFRVDALEPLLRCETVENHYGRHHREHLDQLNRLIAGTDLEKLDLAALIRIMSAGKGPPQNRTRRAILDHAGQAWNHDFYWHSLWPHRPQRATPGGLLARRICLEFGSLDGLKRQFMDTALALVGAGWIWLHARRDGSLAVTATANADTLCAIGNTALLCCDVWEHAYYLEHREDRAAYLEAFWELANWNFAAANLGRAEARRAEGLHAAAPTLLRPMPSALTRERTAPPGH